MLRCDQSFCCGVNILLQLILCQDAPRHLTRNKGSHVRLDTPYLMPFFRHSLTETRSSAYYLPVRAINSIGVMYQPGNKKPIANLDDRP